MMEPIKYKTRRMETSVTQGLVIIITYETVEYILLAIAPKPQGKCGHLIIVIDLKSGLYKFLQIYDLTNVF